MPPTPDLSAAERGASSGGRRPSLLGRAVGLFLAGVAVTMAISHEPMRWHVRGALLASGVAVAGYLLGLLSRRPTGQTRVGAMIAMGWFISWCVLANLAVRYLRLNAFTYFRYEAASFGPLWDRRIPVFAHIVAGMTALVLGPLQFWSGLRARALRFHRWMGRLYVISVFLAAACAYYLSCFISPFEGGAVTGISMAILATAWLGATAMGLREIGRRRLASHREWMIRSYVLTFAFVNLRWFQDTPWILRLGPTEAVVPGIVWAAWILPLAAVECWLRRGRLTKALA